MDVDVLVVGGGIAGTSIGWQLAADRSVLVLEHEDQLGVHATGRSAAVLSETLESKEVRALTIAGRPFLDDPPEGFGPSPLRSLPVLYAARLGAEAALDVLHDEVVRDVPDVERRDATQVERACPYLRPGVFGGGLLEPRAAGIDVDALHQGFARGIRARGSEVRRRAGLVAATHDGAAWAVTDAAGEHHRAQVIVDAAGAWADDVARRCGVPPMGIQPYRRTIFGVPIGDLDLSTAAMVIDAGSEFYLRPEAGQLLCSPMDQTPMAPGDARPDQLDIARALELVDDVTVLAPRRVVSSWAGLRSYAPDRLPVVGPAPDQPAFFWYAGQGGFGVQTSPGLSRLGAAVLDGRDLPADLAARGLTPETLSPKRFG